MNAANVLLKVEGVSKSYGHVRALTDVSLTVNAGEVTALIGDNGAGKSTLVKIISGVATPDTGRILIRGEPRKVRSPSDAKGFGIETVHQDLAVAPDLSAAANMFLGREEVRGGILRPFNFLSKRSMLEKSRKAFTDLGVELRDPSVPIAHLSGGQRQSVAVARAAYWAKSLIILDEPTAALGVKQTRKVLELIRRIRDTGTAVLLISHNMPDVLAVSDRIEALRLGRNAASFLTSEVDGDDLVAAMTGARSFVEGGEDRG